MRSLHHDSTISKVLIEVSYKIKLTDGRIYQSGVFKRKVTVRANRLGVLGQKTKDALIKTFDLAKKYFEENVPFARSKKQIKVTNF